MSVISVKVNGKSVELFDSDSNDTFLQRVASLFKLHPNFLEEIDIDKLKKGDSLKIDTLLNEIQDYKYDTENINNNIEFMSVLSEKYNKNSNDIIVKLFLSVHPFFNREITDEFYLTELLPLEQALKNSDLDTKLDEINSINDFFKIENGKSQKDDFMKDMKQRINVSIQEANALAVANKEFAEMKSISLSEISVDKDESELKLISNLKKSDYSLSTIFSNIVCMESTPFLSYDNLYKIYQDLNINIPDDWSNSFKEFMVLKIRIDEEKYTNAFILFENDLLTINVEVKYGSFTFISSDEKQIKDFIKDKLKECFSNFSDFSISSEREINIYETVMIPDQKFNTYVLNDIIMNNDIFSKFLAVNESIQTTKKKSGLYVHYFLKNDKGTCNITTVGDGDSDLVRLRIKKAKNEDVIKEFLGLIGKLLYIYKKNEKNIIDFYKNYIPNFPKEKVKKEILEQKKQNLQKQVPDLFVSGYPYKCQYPPVIISDEETKEYPPERVMSYPTKGEGKPHNYLCNDEKNGYIYVGLRDNTLKNRKRYKYIPCCFKSDQTKRRGPYQEYFKGEVLEKGPQQNIIITNKLVRNEEYGLLPKNIDKLLTTFDDSYNYLRKGVNLTGLSFLECVLEGALDIADYSALPQKTKLERLEKEYNKLKNYKYISVASQENPNKSEEQMKLDIESQKDTYLDPLQWIKLCEVIYKCKIILFSRNQGEKDGIVTIPNHELVYLQEKLKDQKLILIYEHFGTDLDLEHPKCELIIKWDSELSIDEGSTNYFMGSVSKNIYSFYSSLINQYYYKSFNKKLSVISLFDLTILNSLKPQKQIIDNYGKARGIIVNDVLLLSDPFPPIKAERYSNDSNDSNYYKLNDLKKVMDLVNKNDIKILSQIIVDGTLKEINMEISGIYFTAKVNQNTEINDITIDNIEKYPQTNTDLKYNIFMRRLAFVLAEYFSYYYSYFRSSHIEEDDLESIKSFIKSKVKVVNYKPPYKLSNKPNISLNILKETNFTDGLNGKFLVENNDVLKRLIYYLRTQLYNNKNSIINYHKNKEIYYFYKETSDFSENPLNIIVKNTDDLEKIDNTIYERLRPEKNKFFMHNDLIKDRPILLQKTSSRKDAFLISSNWVRNGKVYNYENADPLDNEILYLYHSIDDIKVKKDIIFDNKDNSYALKYRKDDEDHFLGLINI